MLGRAGYVPAVLALCLGCTGQLEGNDDALGESSDAISCEEPTLGASPMRRLTRWEYNNTIKDLLGDASEPASNFAPEAVQFGFDNNADGATYNAAIIEDYERVSREVAKRAVADIDGLLGCDLSATGEDACMEAFLPTFAQRAFRRPLSEGELTRLNDFYLASKVDYGFSDAVEMLVSAVLQSPHFLYRIELGTADPAAPNAVRLTPFETATRLSYLLWGTMPDDDLMAAAEAGELETPEQVRAYAEGMLDDTRGARVMLNFYSQWTHLHEVQNLQKQDEAFTPAIAALMEQETEAFIQSVVRDGDGTMHSLLTDNTSFMNAELAAYYGVSGVEGDALVPVALDEDRASGLLTQGAVMSRLAHPEQASAVNRGLFVLEKLLCSPPPPPPNNIDATLPPFDPDVTSRQQLEQKTSEKTCNACHQLMNPIGFAFGHYDELGRWQDDEHGLSIDTSATISGTDLAGEYEGHTDMLEAIASSPQMHACVNTDWFRYAFGRDVTEEDVCTTEPALEQFIESGGNIRALLLALTESPAFLYRTRLDIEEPLDTEKGDTQ